MYCRCACICTSIKNNEIEGWSRDGRLKKYINKICRVNHIHYIHPMLAFLDYHVPVDGDTLWDQMIKIISIHFSPNCDAIGWKVLVHVQCLEYVHLWGSAFPLPQSLLTGQSTATVCVCVCAHMHMYMYMYVYMNVSCMRVCMYPLSTY